MPSPQTTYPPAGLLKPYPANVASGQAAAVRRAGLDPAATFYCLRHTSISWALKSGVPAQALAEYTGTSVRMIEKHYGKFLRADKRAMLDAALPSMDLPVSKVERLS